MKRTVMLVAIAALAATAWLLAQTVDDKATGSLTDGFRLVEVASVSDAMEQLYGERAYMSHEMRPLSPAKFAGPAVTVQLKKEEHKEGAAASQGMLDADRLRRLRARSTSWSSTAGRTTPASAA